MLFQVVEVAVAVAVVAVAVVVVVSSHLKSIGYKPLAIIKC